MRPSHIGFCAPRRSRHGASRVARDPDPDPNAISNSMQEHCVRHRADARLAPTGMIDMQYPVHCDCRQRLRVWSTAANMRGIERGQSQPAVLCPERAIAVIANHDVVIEKSRRHRLLWDRRGPPRPKPPVLLQAPPAVRPLSVYDVCIERLRLRAKSQKAIGLLGPRMVGWIVVRTPATSDKPSSGRRSIGDRQITVRSRQFIALRRPTMRAAVTKAA